MIKFITLTCESNKTRMDTIIDTWSKGYEITFLSDKKINNNTISFDYLPSDYASIYLRYIEYFKCLKKDDLKFDWYMFTDDDTFVNLNNIKKLLEDKDPNDLITFGHTGKLHKDGTDADGVQTGFPLGSIKGDATLPLTYYSGGAGFILSKKSMEKIIDYVQNGVNIPFCYNGDVTFGFWLVNNQIKINDIKGFWWTNPQELNHGIEHLVECYSYHYIDEKNMKNLYEKLYNNAG